MDERLERMVAALKKNRAIRRVGIYQGVCVVDYDGKLCKVYGGNAENPSVLFAHDLKPGDVEWK